MQLPNLDRTLPPQRSVNVDVVDRVVPVAPVNPVESAKPSVSMISEISSEAKIKASEASQKAVDPLQGGSEGDRSMKNWTEKSPAPGKLDPLPKEPMSKILMDHVHALWTASAKAVEVFAMNNTSATSNPVQNQVQVEARNANPMLQTGSFAKESLTYSPQTIKKTGAVS